MGGGQGKMPEERVLRWYFGGLASAGAACVTHPLDLMKVHMQTQQGKASVSNVFMNVVKNDGVLSLYNGLSASLLRQLTYSMARFGIYGALKDFLAPNGEPLPFATTLLMAAAAGGLGGVVGTPADMVNVRMQNDMKVPKDQRRNYKHAIDGLIRVIKEEGPSKILTGWQTATGRAILMTMGQLSFYDKFKELLLQTGMSEDNPSTHFTASLMAGGVATFITQPLDVLKTRAMNSKPGEFKGLLDLAMYTAKQGPMGFFKGFSPAFVRLAPQTILTFMFLEQLRINFGEIKEKPDGKSKK